MSLDLTRVASQVISMITGLKDGREERQKRLDFALETIGNPAIDLEKLRKKIKASRTSWLVAELVDGLEKRYPVPPIPTDFTVIASDGSHIDVDRHRPNRCYLINVGTVLLTYGSKPDAVLSSMPQLYADEKDAVITPPGGGREQPVEGNILGIKRSTEECHALVEAATGVPTDNDCLALLDGTLILWGLEAYPDFVGDVLLHEGFLSCLDKIKRLNNNRRISLASYISFPRSTDVVNTLRVAVCPHEAADCDEFCPPGKERDCDGVTGVRDRDIFSELLGEGERSELFISPSKVVKEHYGDHRVHFFYLNAGEETARIEIPQWVAQNEQLLNLTHSLVLDQCHRGHGYPVALSEAHEQAVVTGADRENFWALVEAEMIEGHMQRTGSAKSLSKRTRWI
jgi:hypothetical protein